VVWMGIGLHALLGARRALADAVTHRLRQVRWHGDERPPGEADPTDEVTLAA
jgi:hypothetical protein